MSVNASSVITPNRLTILRILLAFFCPIILLSERSVAIELAVVVAFTVACITDWLDGHLARKHSLITAFGKIADPIADKLLILGLMAVFVIYELYSVWWLVLIALREVLVTVTRLMRLARGQVIPAEAAGKIKVGFQIGSVYLSLLTLIVIEHASVKSWSGDTIHVIRTLNLIGVALAMLSTVISGLIFFNRLRRLK